MATETNHTIYIHNINEKVKKPVLKKSLHSIFSQFGRIIEIVACRGIKLRGQAWVVFDDKAAATNALKQMQGFPFYDKPMKIEFAKSKSDIIARKDGTFTQREKRPRTGPQKGAKGAKAPQAAPAAAGMGGAPPGAAVPVGGAGMGAMGVAPPMAQQQHLVMQQQHPMVPGVVQPPNPPNSILFAQNLPGECTQAMLTMLFQQYRGLKEVRMVPGAGPMGKGMAFVEFEDIALASLALQGLAGFKLTQQDTLQLTYAK